MNTQGSLFFNDRLDQLGLDSLKRFELSRLGGSQRGEAVTAALGSENFLVERLGHVEEVPNGE